MALRLRRACTLSYNLLHRSLHQLKPFSPISSHLLSLTISNPSPTATVIPSFTQLTRPFTSTSTLFRKTFDPETDEIGPDTVLFEGCDFNHWLITMDFPKDSNLTREQMIETYVNTAAQVFGSVEEAKKNIYALSTTTYQGFQVLCSEDTSDKFKNLPGVVFVLPDSYIDPVNKEYGGDKYVNGEIFPRPPPVHYGRRDNNVRRRRDNYGPPQQQQNYGPPQQQQNYGPPQQQNYGPPQQQQSYGPPQQQQNYGPPQQQNYGPPQQQRSYGPPQQQQRYGPPQQQQSYGPPQQQQRYGPPQKQPDYGPPQKQPDYGPPQPRQNHEPSQQQNYVSPPQQQNYGTPPQQQNYGLEPRKNYGPPPQPNYESTQQQSYGNYPNSPPQQNYGPPGSGDRRSFTSPSDGYRGNLDQAEPRNHYAEGQRDFQQGNFQSHVAPEQRGFSQGAAYGSSPGGTFEQAPVGQRNFSSTGNN